MKRIVSTWALGLSLIVIVPLTAGATDQKDGGNLLQDSGAPAADVVQLQTAWSVDQARPGDTVSLAIIFDIKDGFHINAGRCDLAINIAFSNTSGNQLIKL